MKAKEEPRNSLGTKKMKKRMRELQGWRKRGREGMALLGILFIYLFRLA